MLNNILAASYTALNDYQHHFEVYDAMVILGGLLETIEALQYSSHAAAGYLSGEVELVLQASPPTPPDRPYVPSLGRWTFRGGAAQCPQGPFLRLTAVP